MTTTRGIKKVSENILTDGRAIIVTEKDKDQYDWNEIPVGSKFIDTKTGIEQVKLEGESDWVPTNTKNDGTICIAKDTILKEETFTIVSLDDGDGTFTYENSNGEARHMPISTEGYHVFEVETGSYMPSRNQLEVWIDDILRRNVSSGGLIEINEHRFALTEKLVVGMEITAKYASVFRIGNPYPRFFINSNTPEDSENGDFWLDTDATLSDALGENIEGQDYKISFDNITGKPTTIKGYGIVDKLSYEGHTHKADDISGLPTSLPANGGNADTVDFCHAGVNAGNVLKIQSNGKIPAAVMPDHTHTVSEIMNLSSALNPVAAKLGRNADTTKPMQFNWTEQDGQPSLVWGGNDGSNMYVYNPANFTVANAKSADTINGKAIDSLFNYGKTTPTMTALVDWDTMSTKFGYSSPKETVTTRINGQTVTLSIPSCYNIRHYEDGLFSYGGDKSGNGLQNGDIILKEDFRNYDKIAVYVTNDNGDFAFLDTWETWQIDFMMKNISYRLPIIRERGIYWEIYGYYERGSNTHNRCSTATLWRCANQNCGIIEIYGIKY